MSITKTIGGDRLGSGKRMKVNLHGYERSTHDLGYMFRSTMSAGTLVPFMKQLALPGDTFDINLGCDVKTHPTVGPLFASAKVQLDIFLCPIRLYNSGLNNNLQGIGNHMADIKLPLLEMKALPIENTDTIDTAQINPSCVLSYLGIRGIGRTSVEAGTTRRFNALPYISYIDCVKNYYCNKQEEQGAVIHTPAVALIETVDDITIFTPPSYNGSLPEFPSNNTVGLTIGSTILIAFTGTQPIPNQIMINTVQHGTVSLDELTNNWQLTNPGELTATFNGTKWGNTTFQWWRYRDLSDVNNGKPAIFRWDLNNVDVVRQEILAQNYSVPYVIDEDQFAPFGILLQQPNGVPNTLSSQEGLCLKTYQSDLFNNWMNTEWLDGTTGINQITAIDTSSGEFQINTFLIAKKLYDVLNRVAISGGSYRDWLDTVYDHIGNWQCSIPMYMGGLVKELVFQEVISNAANGDQPLGTLGGRGVMANKHKGGKVVIKVDEPAYILGIVSITPRVDYSQGNDWDTYALQTMDDLHKPGLDEIGFQELITEQMAWWDTEWDTVGAKWVQKSAGKQPAWMNYMTSVNKTYGNFAMKDNEMFMTFNRRYEYNSGTESIKDLTTYIDPSKFNFIFAETALDAQNYWTQIAVDITARRKMSAKIMPNL